MHVWHGVGGWFGGKEVLTPSLPSKKGTTSKCFKNSYLKAKPRIWAGLSSMCHILSAAGKGVLPRHLETLNPKPWKGSRTIPPLPGT